MTYALVFGYVLLASNMSLEECEGARIAFRNLTITSGVPITYQTMSELTCQLEYLS